MTAKAILKRLKPDVSMTISSLREANMPKPIKPPNRAAIGKNTSKSFGTISRE